MVLLCGEGPNAALEVEAIRQEPTGLTVAVRWQDRPKPGGTQTLVRTLKPLALPPSRDEVRIVMAEFGIEAGMIGAAALAFDGIGASR